LAKCNECSIQMGYAESQAALNYNGFCITCHVKNRVQTKVLTSKDPVFITSPKATETVFNKFEEMLVTTESTINLRIKKRVGIISADYLSEFPKTSIFKIIFGVFRKRKRKQTDFVQEAMELAMLELKSKAIRADANGIIGLQVEYVVLGDLKKNGILISLVGTAVKI
jgi:uncharacterized protein YbjQ (UPF0145 family)